MTPSLSSPGRDGHARELPRTLASACAPAAELPLLSPREARPGRLPLAAPAPRWKFGGRKLAPWLLWLVLLFGGLELGAQTTNAPGTNAASLMPFHLSVGVDAAQQPRDVDVAIQILFAVTLLSLAPSIILLMTCFTRIVIVLSFVRTAISLQGTPSNQIIIGLSLFITFFIMAPTWDKINSDALQPYMSKEISSGLAVERATTHIRAFMLKQARPKDLELFMELAKMGPTPPAQLPLQVVVPGFIISELRTAFQMGFLLFVPFILIDLVVATVLMSMGMMMMPPMTIALPLKILLFVLVDGWGLIVRSIVLSFTN